MQFIISTNLNPPFKFSRSAPGGGPPVATIYAWSGGTVCGCCTWSWGTGYGANHIRRYSPSNWELLGIVARAKANSKIWASIDCLLWGINNFKSVLISTARTLSIYNSNWYNYLLGSTLCRPHTCRHCGTDVDQQATHGLSCKKSVGRHYRHSVIYDILYRVLSTACIPSRLEPSWLVCTNEKCPDDVPIEEWKAPSVGCDLPRHPCSVLPKPSYQ